MRFETKVKDKIHELVYVKKIELIIAYFHCSIIATRGHLSALFKRVHSGLQLTGFTGRLIITVRLQIYQTLTAQIDLSSGW